MVSSIKSVLRKKKEKACDKEMKSENVKDTEGGKEQGKLCEWTKNNYEE